MLLHRESLAMAFQKPRDRLFVLFFLLLSGCLVVLLFSCLVVCIAYTFNKITKQLNNKTTILNIDVLLKDKPTKSVHFFHISDKDYPLLTTN